VRNTFQLLAYSLELNMGKIKFKVMLGAFR